MRYEDQLYSHPGYYNGALAAIEIYTRVHDHPDLTEEKLSKLSPLKPFQKSNRKPRSKKPTENELPRRLKKQNKKPKRPLRQLATERNPSHLLLMMILMERNYSRLLPRLMML
jgi:hypothetical protein